MMICLSLAEIGSDELEQFLDQEELIELRLDLLADIDPAKVCRRRADIVATFRPTTGVDDATRLAVLTKFIEAGAKYVDIELEAKAAYLEELIESARKHDCTVIISYHNFLNTPASDDLLKIIARAKTLGASVVKIACQANSIRDALRLLSLLENNTSLVVVGMGECGKLTRVLSPLLGGLFTYASADSQRLTAPGQISAAKLRTVYEHLAHIGVTQSSNIGI
jgi:3-dehydroquinate dehydratase type I